MNNFHRVSAVSAVFAVACSLASVPAFSADLKGVHLPESVRVANRPLLLNGIGLRQKTVFNVDVYVAGLYLQSPSRDGEAIVGSHDLKKLVVVFLRDVPSSRITMEWNKGFREHCDAACAARLSPQLARFDALIPDMHRGLEVDFNFLPDGMTVSSGGRTEKIAGREFAEVALASFIGRKGYEDNVRDDLLVGRPHAGGPGSQAGL